MYRCCILEAHAESRSSDSMISGFIECECSRSDKRVCEGGVFPDGDEDVKAGVGGWVSMLVSGCGSGSSEADDNS